MNYNEKYNDDQTELQQIIQTIRGYAIVMACITFGFIGMYQLIIRIARM